MDIKKTQWYVVFLSGSELYVQVFFKFQLSRGGRDPINQFNPATYFVPVPSHENLDIQRHMPWSVNSVKMRGDCFFC
jgi:hypothetical protein